MPSFEHLPPPTKKRKTLTTYGSQSVFDRALRAVRNAVPASLRPSDPGARDSTLKAEAHISGLDSFSSQGHDSPRTNAVSSPGAEQLVLDRGSPSSSQRETRASKKAHTKHVPTADSTPRKRRKYEADAGLQDRHALSSPVRRVNGSRSTIPKDTGHEELSMDELDDVGGHESSPVRRDSSYDGQRTVEALPNGRIQRKLRGRPRRDEDSRMGSSTKQNPTTPETQVSTPGQKRGRPRNHPTPAPTPPDAEENEMGFRKITKDQHPSSIKAFDSSKKERNTPKTQRLSNVQSDVQINGKYTDSHNSLANAARVRNGHKTPGAEKVNSHFNEPDVPMRQQDDVFDISDDAPTLDQKLHPVLQNSTAKFLKILKTSPEGSLSALKTEILENLTGKHSHLVNLEEETRKIQQLVTQTVLAGEGNSMLVIGPRGSGKTTLVESVLSDLTIEHHGDFIVIRLNGFIHTDDKLALREIWRQLGREVAAEDEATGIRTNYADTLTSLLALLAHSSEEGGKQNETARSVVFVIDEFDLFTSHPRQTLLYNLFDVAQSRNAPIAVLGLTTRTDVVESLEKRVKSRFGQRYIYLSHPKSFSSFEAMCRSALASREAAGGTFAKRAGSNHAKLQQVRAAWNEYVDALFNHDAELDKRLRYLFAHSNCVANFQSSMLLPIGLLSASSMPTGRSITGSSLPVADSKLQILPSLSGLELALLIAAARLDVILDTEVCNFKVVYDEYVQLASRVKLQSSAAGQTAIGGGARVWGQEVARGAWERLMDLELILTANTAGLRSSSNSAGVMCRVDVALEEIGPSVPRLGATMSKWCKEI